MLTRQGLEQYLLKTGRESLPVFYPASLFPISKLNALQIKSLALGIIPI